MSTNASVMSNPAAPVAVLNRPVMLQDIADKLGLARSTVKCYLYHSAPPSAKQSTVEQVRATAKELEYDRKAEEAYQRAITPWYKQVNYDLSNAPDHIEGPVTLEKIAEAVGLSVATVHRGIKKQSGSIWELAMKYGYENPHDPSVKERKAKEKAERKAQEYYRSTPFHTAEECTKYMSYLRSQGYGNFDIARMSGTTPVTVRRHIGSEPTELARHNRAMAQHIRAQKNAARKQYVLNKPIIEYNKRVEEHNRMKAELAQLQLELLEQKPGIVQAAQTKISFPLIDLHTVQPTALQ